LVEALVERGGEPLEVDAFFGDAQTVVEQVPTIPSTALSVALSPEIPDHRDLIGEGRDQSVAHAAHPEAFAGLHTSDFYTGDLRERIVRLRNQMDAMRA
jgi:hypothetical protein